MGASVSLEQHSSLSLLKLTSGVVCVVVGWAGSAIATCVGGAVDYHAHPPYIRHLLGLVEVPAHVQKYFVAAKQAQGN